MQNLIMEILQAQPSLRDSKTYLDSFAPRPRNRQHDKRQHQKPPFPFNTPSTSKLPQDARNPASAVKGSLFTPSRLRKSDKRSRGKAREDIPLQPDTSSIALQANSYKFAQPDEAAPSTSSSSLRAVDLQGRVTTATQESLAETLTTSPVHQHTALVKVQGPFSSRQLESIAEGMVYLKRLGLMSVIVIDSEEDTWRSAITSFSPRDGHRIASDEDSDLNELAQWMTTEKKAGKSSATVMGKLQEVLRKRMLLDVTKLSELLTQKGAPARPFSHAVMRVDADQVAQIDQIYPPSLTGQSNSHRYQWAAEAPSMDRSPLVSDDGLTSIRKALASDMIPVIAPLALYDDADELMAPRTVCVSADDVLVGLARGMSAQGRSQIEESDEVDAENVDMMPLRLMVINREGGIPSHARGGNPHLSINLASEYNHVANSFIWDESHPTALGNLSMVRDCLTYMPQTSSGVVVSHRSPKSLIANLITNKAAYSPSLPHRLLADRANIRHNPTIIRPGLDIRVIQDYNSVDWDKMTDLLEASFKRKLDAQPYLARLQKSLDFVIVTGDYQGAAIVTHEYAPGEDSSTHEAISYLDKFAVLPSLQGSGAVDFLWGALRDEVHGLGLLDALNDNGGKAGFGKGKDLVWKSRSDNPVNKWYYERSNGFIKIDTIAKKPGQEASTPAWSMFWCDAEERIATMAGERRLAAEATPDEVLDMAKERVISREVQRELLSEEDEEEFTRRQRKTKNSYVGVEGMRDLSQLHPGDGSQRLLPVIAPEETGRLQRWAKCMSIIPSAWL
jgi:amino-acid N-acetyltransferase